MTTVPDSDNGPRPSNTHGTNLGTTPQGEVRDGPGQSKDANGLKLSDEDIYKYVIRADAIAKCFVRDCLEVKDARSEWKFWWLGSVPVRCFELVGTVVGIVVYERKMFYTIDDGTDVLDVEYEFKLKPPPPTNPKQSKGKETVEKEYLPGPQIEVGMTVKVVGKLDTSKYGRKITLDNIEKCSPNAEPRHWLEVSHLHQTKYKQPFVLPSIPPASTTQLPSQKPPSIDQPPPSPSTVEASSPVKPAPPSPALSEAQRSTPARLRHPSRLSSRDLTPNTFRIYMKHYMVVVTSTLPPLSQVSETTGFGLSQEDIDPRTPVDPLTTPRKRSNPDPHRTPRLRRIPDTPSTLNSFESCNDPLSHGLSISYLMRVPELQELGHRVVRTEARRREKAAKLKEKQLSEKNIKSISSSGSGITKNKSVVSMSSGHTEPTSVKVKRLFAWAIRSLFDEGSIVSGDGPGRRWEAIGPGAEDIDRSRNLCWRDVTNTTISNSTIGSVSSDSISNLSFKTNNSNESHTTPIQQTQDPEELSYLPVSNTLLKPFVVKTLSDFSSRRGRRSRGASSAEILNRMRQKDERWERLVALSIEECLDSLLGADGIVWKIQADKWELVSMT